MCVVGLWRLCDTWLTLLWCVGLCFLWAEVAALASVAAMVTAGRARPRDTRRCLREKFTAGSIRKAWLRVHASIAA